MSDDALIRLFNLKATGVTAKQLEEAKIGRYSYCRDLLTGQKSFGEKIARKIENNLGWVRGCLDTEGGCFAVTPSPTIPAHQTTPSGGADTQEGEPTIPTSMKFSPSNLSSSILLLGNLLGKMDRRSRKVMGLLLSDLADDPDDAEDVARKASGLADKQKPVTKNHALNKAIHGNQDDAVETNHSPLEH